MIYYNPNEMINEIRRRMAERVKMMQMHDFRDGSTVRRIEGGNQSPSGETVELMLNAMDVPMEGFYYPLLTNQPMGVLLIRDRLIQALDLGDLKLAEELLMQLEGAEGFGKSDSQINYQFILSQKARLLEQQGKPPDIVLPLINEGLALTLENFGIPELKGKVLLFEEPELLHSLARVYAKTDLFFAIQLLDVAQEGLSLLPTDDRGRERKLAPILLTLAEYYLKAEDYPAALSACDKGASYSTSRMVGRLNPHFAYIKAIALKRTGHTTETKRLITASYFGHIILGNTNEAENALISAKEEFDLQIETYSADSLPPIKKAPYSRGEAVECDSLHNMVKVLREKAGVTVDELAQGICNKATLSRFENGKIKKNNMFFIESIMQRLGRRVEPYHIFFPSSKDFYDKKARDKVSSLSALGKFKEMGERLSKLENKKAFLTGVNLQFIKLYKTTLHAQKHGYDDKAVPEMLLDALRITLPKFDERYVDRYQLAYTHCEIVAINQLAMHYGDIENYSRALDLFAMLRYNMDRNYVDEKEKSRMYATVLFNYTTYLGRAGQRLKALFTAEEGIEYALRHRQLSSLANLYFNKAYNLLKMGKSDECVLWFVLSYYCDILFEGYGWSYASLTRNFVKEELGIIFD